MNQQSIPTIEHANYTTQQIQSWLDKQIEMKFPGISDYNKAAYIQTVARNLSKLNPAPSAKTQQQLAQKIAPISAKDALYYSPEREKLQTINTDMRMPAARMVEVKKPSQQ